MTIALNNVVPFPIENAVREGSDIWKTQTVFESGEHYLINAASGKGKSTFVQLLYGIRKDYSGEVLIDGKNIQSYSIQEMAELRQSKITILFQDLRLFPELTARDNIALNSTLSASVWNDRVEEMADRLKITHLLDKKVAFLSYGERQRTATVRALVQPFQWILLDEPFSHLDDDNTRASFELIKEVSQSQQAGIILTSLGKDSFVDFKHELFL